jgi:hypothetical protein
MRHCCLLGRTGLGVRQRRGASCPRWRGGHPGRLALLRRGSPGGSGKRPAHGAALLAGGRCCKPARTYAPEAADHPALASKKTVSPTLSPFRVLYLRHKELHTTLAVRCYSLAALAPGRRGWGYSSQSVIAWRDVSRTLPRECSFWFIKPPLLQLLVTKDGTRNKERGAAHLLPAGNAVLGTAPRCRASRSASAEPQATCPADRGALCCGRPAGARTPSSSRGPFCAPPFLCAGQSCVVGTLRSAYCDILLSGGRAAGLGWSSLRLRQAACVPCRNASQLTQ